MIFVCSRRGKREWPINYVRGYPAFFSLSMEAACAATTGKYDVLFNSILLQRHLVSQDLLDITCLLFAKVSHICLLGQGLALSDSNRSLP